MKVLLIKPCWNYPVDRADSTYNRIWPPLDLLNCAAFLRRRGHQVSVLDANAKRLAPANVAAIAKTFDRVFITSSSLDRWQCPNINLDAFLSTVKAIRSVTANFGVMGTHGTVKPEEILALTKAKWLIRGEPEATVVDIIEAQEPDGIAGISYLDQYGYRANPDRAPLSLVDFPMPAFELLDYSAYFYEVLGERFALMETARGCPFSCMFCVKFMYGQGMRAKSLDQIKAELDYLINYLDIRSLYIMDLEFTLYRETVLEICDYLARQSKSLRWCCQTRADAVDRELLMAMKRAGCEIVHFGVESGSEPIARTLGKNIKIQDIQQGVELAKRAGIRTVCFFMFGLPGETLADMKQTLALAKSLNPTYASFHIALPYPGTRFYELVKNTLEPDLFPTAYTGDVSREELERIVRGAFFSYYFRPGYLIGRLRGEGFKSLLQQAVFFVKYYRSRWMT